MTEVNLKDSVQSGRHSRAVSRFGHQSRAGRQERRLWRDEWHYSKSANRSVGRQRRERDCRGRVRHVALWRQS